MMSVFFSRFGIAASYALASFVGHELFHTLFVSFAMSVFTVAGKTSSVAAPQVAELSKPTPMLFFIAFGVMGMIASLLIQKPTNLNEKIQPEISESSQEQEKKDNEEERKEIEMNASAMPVAL